MPEMSLNMFQQRKLPLSCIPGLQILLRRQKPHVKAYPTSPNHPQSRQLISRYFYGHCKKGKTSSIVGGGAAHKNGVNLPKTLVFNVAASY